MRKKTSIWVGVILCLILSAVLTTGASADMFDSGKKEMDELDEGSFYTLHDKSSGEELERLNRLCFEEDEIILSDNRRYRISEIEEDGYKAHCEQVMDYEAPVMAKPVVSAVDTAAAAPKAVAIYATHSDECYVPTSGTESRNGGGDILEVAGVIAQYLESQGIEVLHSENIHDPHDADAYQRSRETAAELLSSGNVSMIIDVHRDGVPDPAYYEKEVEGEKITQIRLVVGQANENSAENEAFAEQLKAYYDEVQPGLIKSIYIAKGNYNQDMAPNSVLLEVGTHTNTLQEAEAGAQLFAEGLPEFLGLSADTWQSAENNPSAANEGQPAQNVQAEKSGRVWPIVLILGVVIIGGAVAYWLMRKDG